MDSIWWGEDRLFNDYKIIPAILCPGKLILSMHQQPFLTETDGAQAGLIDAEVDKIFFGAQGPALAQSHIVFGGSTWIAIAFDANFSIGLTFEKVTIGFNSRYLVIAYIG